MTGGPPQISVVVPTFNRRDRLQRVLASLAAQDVDEPFEVVVVSDGSSDGTDEFLASDTVPIPVVACFQPNQGPAAARNSGVARASGELIVFIDDDVVAEPSLIRTHRDAHRRLGGRVVVIGPMLNPPDHTMSPWIAWEQAMLAKQYDDMMAGKYSATSRQFYTGNASLSRQHLIDVGGFDTAFRRAEDIELAFRLDDLGINFHFEPAARGLHYAERSYESWKSAAYLYGQNEMRFARDLNRTWVLDFSFDRYRSHHPIIRWLIPRSVASSRWRRMCVNVSELLALRRGRPATVRQYALSLVYAIEFHAGVADELGSPSEFERVIVGREAVG